MENILKNIVLFYFLLFVCFVNTTSVIADEHLPIPKIEGRVTDQTNTLSSKDREEITKLLRDYEKVTTHQIGVLIIPTLNGESIESYSLRVANSWKLGHKGVDNGVVVTLAMKERKVRIELGRGMEKYISNSKAKSIIVNSMIPAFRKYDYSKGLKDGLQQIMTEARKFSATK